LVNSPEHNEILFDDVKHLLADLLERAVRDLLILSPDDPYFETAFGLIFDDEYLIYFDEPDEKGHQKPDGETLSLDEILSVVDIDKEFLRCQMRKRLYEMKRPLACQLFGKELDWK